METIKLKLLKRHNKKNPGDVIEVRPGDARVLKAVGVAEDYVEPPPPPPARRTTTRVMQPETNQSEVVEKKLEDDTGSTTRSPYFRRDMRPEE